MSPHVARARLAALQAAIDALRLARPAVWWLSEGHEDTHEGRALAALEAAQAEARRELVAHTDASLSAVEQAAALVATHGGMAGDVARAIYGHQDDGRARAYWAAVVMVLDPAGTAF